MITYESLTPVGRAFMYKRLRGTTGHLYIKMAAWPATPPGKTTTTLHTKRERDHDQLT